MTGFFDFFFVPSTSYYEKEKLEAGAGKTIDWRAGIFTSFSRARAHNGAIFVK